MKKIFILLLLPLFSTAQYLPVDANNFSYSSKYSGSNRPPVYHQPRTADTTHYSRTLMLTLNRISQQADVRYEFALHKSWTMEIGGYIVYKQSNYYSSVHPEGGATVSARYYTNGKALKGFFLEGGMQVHYCAFSSFYRNTTSGEQMSLHIAAPAYSGLAAIGWQFFITRHLPMSVSLEYKLTTSPNENPAQEILYQGELWERSAYYINYLSEWRRYGNPGVPLALKFRIGGAW